MGNNETRVAQAAERFMADVEAVRPKINTDELVVDDFFTPKPYEMLWALRDSKFDQSIAEKKMQIRAKELGLTNFIKMWRDFQHQQRMRSAKPVGEVTDFGDMPYEQLASGGWICDGNTIYTVTQFGTQIACTHPILPIERLINIDTGAVKIKLAFKPSNTWREITVERSTIASAQKIIALADMGVAVTSESAKNLVRYLAEVEALNMERIPTKKSVSRLGWVAPDLFSPYADDLVFDGAAMFAQIYDHVQPKGSSEEWLSIMRECRRKDPSLRIAIAAAFASPILSIIGALPMFVHFWATTTTGKTMILKIAASVWGNPDIGAYIKTFNATTYAMEQYAGFYNSMPLMLDELELIKDRYGQSKFDVYKLTQGVAGGRGRRDGGLREEQTWRLAVITSGEQSITQINDKAGAYARILDIQLDKRIFELAEAQRIAKVIEMNYGHGGRPFVEYCQQVGADDLIRRNEDLIQYMSRHKDLQPKQVMAAAAILLGDELSDECLFQDELGRLTFDELKPFLITQEEADTTTRAYEMLTAWVASNEVKFGAGSIERLGIIDGSTAYIIRDLFNRFLHENNMSAKSVTAGLAKKGLIETFQEGGTTRLDTKKRFGNFRVRTVALRLDGAGENVGPDYLEEPENEMPYYQ